MNISDFRFLPAVNDHSERIILSDDSECESLELIIDGTITDFANLKYDIDYGYYFTINLDLVGYLYPDFPSVDDLDSVIGNDETVSGKTLKSCVCEAKEKGFSTYPIYSIWDYNKNEWDESYEVKLPKKL